ncbi:hypothetical protein FRZ06_07820 [Anoxybacterium hadale]|uniref:Uncharacterized protein n=1 Tax=Anoxybacterium hadale TaxID=3408580 RepID=A0ACD1A9Y8_9FIRM|nr:hypothetical protein FRZ06_07820 [Clostridiales bacterium]
MAITSEEYKKIEMLNLDKHIQLVDGYIATGLDIDDITIHYAVDQERILIVLHSYGFSAGPVHGDETDSKKMYKGLPFQYIEAYVKEYYPGFIEEANEKHNTDITSVNHITIEQFLNENHPDWCSRISKTKSSLFGISTAELNGASYYKSQTERQSSEGKSDGFFNFITKHIKK